MKGSPWTQLRKAWLEYRRAKKEGRNLRAIEAAKKIRAIQSELKVVQSPFPDISEEDLKASRDGLESNLETVAEASHPTIAEPPRPVPRASPPYLFEE